MSEYLKRIRKYDYKIDQFDNEAYLKNPLLKFRLQKIKKKRKFDLLKQKGELEKARLLREPLVQDVEEDTAYKSEKSYIDDIRKFVESAPIPKMLSKIEQKVHDFAPKALRSKYPQIAKLYMADVHAEYDKVMKSFSVRRLIRDTTVDVYQVKPFAFKRLGKTPNYKVFLLRRRKLQDSLFVPYPFIRFIIHQSKLQFPSVLNDFQNYRQQNDGKQVWLTLTEFESMVEKDLQTNSIFLKEEWYPKIVKVLQKHYRKKSVPSDRWPKILNCAKGLINRQISELKVKTFQHIFNVLGNRAKMPYIKFQAIFTGDTIELYPSFDNLIAVFRDIFQQIALIGQKFPALEPQIDRNRFFETEPRLKIEISENYMHEVFMELEASMKSAYSPILSYVDEFRSKFCDLYGQSTKDGLSNFLDETRSFEDYLEKIDFFRNYQVELRKMVYNEYFDFAIINQTKAIAGLKIIAKDFIDDITSYIVVKHQRDCDDISNWFKSVKKRAWEAPKSTESLLANGEFMLEVKNRELEEISERIQYNLKISGVLMEFTEFTEDHRQLQVSIIQWLQDMQDIFEQNSAQFEIYKNQFEEHLCSVTKKFVQDIDDFVPKLSIIDDMYETEKLKNYYSTLKTYIEQLECFEDYASWIAKEEKLFKLPVSQYPILDEIKNYLKPFANLVKLCMEWLRNYYVWMDGPFEYLNARHVEKLVQNFQAEFEKIQKNYRNKIKQDMMGNPVLKFRGQTEDPDPEKHPVPLRLCERMIDWIKGFDVGVHIVKIMCNPALHDRHWKEMSEIAGFDLTPDAGTTLRKITKLGINDKLSSFEIISIGANKELQLQTDLTEMTQKWESIQYPTTTYKDTNIQILSNLDDIQVLLEDQVIRTLTMRGSAFVKPCEMEVRSWYDTLLRTNNVFDEWTRVQTRWLYYLPIFSSEHIVQQIPKEADYFKEINKTYKKYINMFIYDPIVLKTATMPGLLEDLIKSNELLDRVEIGVNAYLDRTRLYFPRFFFLSNFEILQMLSETKNPLLVQPFLSKCYNGIHELNFDDEFNICGMISSFHEEVNFVNKISIAETRGRVEEWLRSVEDEMKLSIRNEITRAYSDFLTTDWIDWVLNWPQMVVLCIVQIFWASDIHSCLANQNRELLLNIIESMKSNISKLTSMVCKSDITNSVKATLRSLCIVLINARDVTQVLLDKSSLSTTEFQWIAQLKYYWRDGMVMIEMIDTTMTFSYEYLGNYDRLVITPLTERCYRTIVAAFRHHLFGALEGTTGTGKVETIKDLARALAIQCRVFNCSAELDYRLFGNFFKGLISCGAWLCLNDFNRIELEVLSVIAEQMCTLATVISTEMDHCVFLGTRLYVDPSCYLCILNNSDYGTRVKLPDNLKVLFRTVAMMVPDLRMIAETVLCSYGFINGRSLAIRLITFYECCSQQLSNADHYDFGLRNIVAALKNCEHYNDIEKEDVQLYGSILKTNLPKLLTTDIPIFMGILNDLFPNINQEIGKPKEHLPRDIFDSVCQKSSLQSTEHIFNKVLHTYETMNSCHSFVIVGESFSCKSTVLKILAEMLSIIVGKSEGDADDDIRHCDMEFINPKSATIKQLFGQFNSITQSWTDGIIPSVFRKFSDSPSKYKWLIFDGPIDCEWIESMHTVLDDNKQLCLASGEVIDLCAGMSMVFETEDLTQASPATVSRLGIIYMDSSDLEWQTIAKSWMERCNPKWMAECRQLIIDLFEWALPPLLNFLSKRCTQMLSSMEIKLITTTFDIFEMIMNDAVESNADDYQKFLVSWIQAAAVYGIVWGIGGLLDKASRDKFDIFHRKLWTCSDDNPPPANLKNKLDITLPSEGNLADYVYLFKQKGAWKHWADLVRRQEPEDTVLGTHVTTIDTGRYSYLLELHIKQNKKMLLVGPNGSGKSALMQHTLCNKLNQSEYLPAFITFNIGTNTNEAQEHLISKLIKLKRCIYGPPKGKKCIAFIDDLNLPARERYGALTSVELLRHYFNYEFMYDLKTNAKIYLENLSIVGACGTPGGSWYNLNTRFLRHFNCFSINESSEETLFRIFSNVLMTGLKKFGHTSDVTNHVNQMITATLRTFNEAILKLKPTPAKSFYRFNIRDISRICNGCAMLRKESVDNKKIFAKIWFHESMREFHDRFIEPDERVWLFNKLCDEIRDTFKDSVEQILETQVNEDTVVTIEDANRLLFGSYSDPKADFPNRRYEEISSFDKLAAIAKRSLDEYNTEKTSKLNIVIFAHVLEHLNRICRIISIPGGNGLIIGTGDSGRKSITKLAAFICKQNFFQTKVEKDYGIAAWKNDIKNVLRSAGGQGKQTIFLLSENEITDDAFLTDIDHLLSSADIPNLWPIDEKQELVEMVRLSAQGGNRNVDISPLEVFSYFVNRCRRNLHIILCFSPIGSSLRTRLRLYPSLLNCCTIDWFDVWPEEALEIVARRYTSDMDITDELKEMVISTCKYFHSSVKDHNAAYLRETGKKNYTTSASYLELVYTFHKLYNSKRIEIMDAKSRYVSGLETLMRAAEAVQTMQVELSELQPKLLAMAENSRLMTLEIEQRTLEASVATEQVKRDELIANDQAAAAQSMEDECSKDLAQAVPVLEDALQALNTLKPSDITLVKSMKNPPSAIKLVMAAVCVMKSVPPDRINDAASGKKIIDYWGPSKRILGDMAFLQSLKDYDKDDINPDMIKKIRKDFIPHKDFQPHVVAKASSAAEGLCKWVKAIENFESVNIVVRPKKSKLLKAKELLKETRKFLAEKRALAAELEAKVIGLYEELEKANEEKQRTEREVESCERKLKRAESLINGLASERIRWTQDVAQLQNLYDHLIGDILISCGMIAYLGPFTKSIRDVCLADWHEYCSRMKVPCSDTFNLIKTLGSDTDIRNWNIDGLSTDRFSIENVIMMYNSCRRCVFVDPQRQANKWIRTMESVNRLQIVNFSQSNYFDILKACIEFGHPILIEDIDEKLEIVLEPILKHNVFSDEDLKVLNLNEKEDALTISDNFRLYLSCNLQYPHFLPDTHNKVNVINFFMDQPGLEEKLLNVVVAKERPDLREQRDKLLVEKAKDKELLNKYENDILTAIAECEGDILENESAIRKMDESKQFCIEILEKQKRYAETEEEIDSFRDHFESVARHAAIIYSCLIDLVNVNTMYQFSLDWFINLYIFSIENANRSKDMARRIKFLINTITKNFYSSVCRSIFEKDKFLFSWVLTTKILLAESKITMEQLRFFVSSDTQEIKMLCKNPDPNWIAEPLWTDLLRLTNLPDFESLIECFIQNISDWKMFRENDDNHFEKIPNPWKMSLTSFQKLILIKNFHAKNITTAIREFISMEMGSVFVNPPHFDIGQSFEESNILTPLIFLLSPGVDPMETLLLFARRLGMIESFQMVSLGKDQESLAEKYVKEAQAQGSWICLQNCHLNTSWLFKLETIWSTMNIYNTTSSFRLWMTTELTTNFPLNLLQSGIKMTFENPKGLQSNLLQIYSNKPLSDSSLYNGCPGKDRPFARLLYSLAFFHAVVQERKQFGSVGWNNAYDFSKTDFEVSIYQMQSFLNQYHSIPYTALNYFIGECNYSGCITDQWDFRLVKTLLSEHIHAEIVTNLSHRFADDDIFILPRRTEHREIVKYIVEHIPNEPNCEVYGLHSNSDMAKNAKLSEDLFTSLSSIMNLSTAQVYNEQTESKLLDVITSAREKMPQALAISSYEKKYPFGIDSPFHPFLVHEAKSFDRLLNEIQTTFDTLERVIEGSIWLTPEIEEICTTILNNKIPAHWQSHSYLSSKPIGSYIRDFYKRFEWIFKCLEEGIAQNVWLSGFFHPQNYFTCLKQAFSRKHRIAFENITFAFYVCNNHEDDKCSSQEGAFISGLYLGGARWNPAQSCIEEQLKHKELDILPVIHVLPTSEKDTVQQSLYDCPLYTTLDCRGTLNTIGLSNNFIIAMLLPTKLEPKHWIKRGVALYCQTNE